MPEVPGVAISATWYDRRRFDGHSSRWGRPLGQIDGLLRERPPARGAATVPPPTQSEKFLRAAGLGSNPRPLDRAPVPTKGREPMNPTDWQRHSSTDVG